MKISAAADLLTAIDFSYAAPDAATLARMREQSAPCALLRADGLLPENSYHRAGRKGCAEPMLAREFVASRLREAAARLAPGYGLQLFDAYRSRETQADLFQMVLADVAAAHPDWDAEVVERQARMFAAHPDDTAASRCCRITLEARLIWPSAGWTRVRCAISAPASTRRSRRRAAISLRRSRTRRMVSRLSAG